MARISIVIATHSRPHLLPRAVESAQKAGKDVEVIVVDDASTDATAEVCRGLEGIRYIRVDQNQGVAGARNVGILASSAEYISFHDDDDLRLPGSLDRQLELLEANSEAGICYGQVLVGDMECKPVHGRQPERLLTGDIFWELVSWNPIICISAVFRKACLFRIGMLDATVPGVDDWDLWVRIAESHTVVAVQDPVAIWRMSTPSSNQGSSTPRGLLSKIARHQSRWLQLPRARAATYGKRREARRRFLNNASDWLIWNAATWLQEGALQYSRKSIIKALLLNPLRTIRPWTFKLLLKSLLGSVESSHHQYGSQKPEIEGKANT